MIILAGGLIGILAFGAGAFIGVRIVQWTLDELERRSK